MIESLVEGLPEIKGCIVTESDRGLRFCDLHHQCEQHGIHGNAIAIFGNPGRWRVLRRGTGIGKGFGDRHTVRRHIETTDRVLFVGEQCVSLTQRLQSVVLVPPLSISVPA